MNTELKGLESRIQRLFSESPETRWNSFLADPTYQPILEEYPYLGAGPFISDYKFLSSGPIVDPESYGVEETARLALLGVLNELSTNDEYFDLRTDVEFIENLRTAITIVDTFYHAMEMNPKDAVVYNPEDEIWGFLRHYFPRLGVWGEIVQERNPKHRLKKVLDTVNKHFDYLVLGNNVEKVIQSYFELNNVPAARKLAEDAGKESLIVDLEKRYNGFDRAVEVAKEYGLHQKVLDLHFSRGEIFVGTQYASAQGCFNRTTEKKLFETIRGQGLSLPQASEFLELVERHGLRERVRQEQGLNFEGSSPKRNFAKGLFHLVAGSKNKAHQIFNLQVGLAKDDIADLLGFKPDILPLQVDYSHIDSRVVNLSGMHIEDYADRCMELASQAQGLHLTRERFIWTWSAYRALRTLRPNSKVVGRMDDIKRYELSLTDFEICLTHSPDKNFESHRPLLNARHAAERGFTQRAVKLFLDAKVSERDIIRHTGLKFESQPNSIDMINGEVVNESGGFEPEHFARYSALEALRMRELGLINTANLWIYSVFHTTELIRLLTGVGFELATERTFDPFILSLTSSGPIPLRLRGERFRFGYS